MTSPASPVDSPALTRGFLFCDLRDYTAFVEANGDQAAAELLGDYRAIVRDAMAATGGGEVRTEGDSFYIVFSSVGAAVRCGLAIVDEAARASAERPDRPVRVGVGVHAGESVAEGDGFVGSAVNIASRICALAAPGEVLVSDTVRSLVRTSLPVTFRSRGRPRLKGIAEPIELFAVSPASATAAARPAAPAARPSRRRLVVVGIAALIVIALAGPLGASVLLRPSEAGLPSPSPTGSGAGASESASNGPPSAAPSTIDVADLPGVIVYVSSQGGNPTAFRSQIRASYPDGSHTVTISDLFTNVGTFAASGDSTRIAYSTDGSLKPHTGNSTPYDSFLWVGNLDGSPPTEWPAQDVWLGPRFDAGEALWPFEVHGWLPTEELVLKRQNRWTGAYRLLAADGHSVRPIDVVGTDLSVSPSGHQVALLRARADGVNLWVAPLEGPTEIAEIQLTNNFIGFAPAWSHDGLRIALSGRNRTHAQTGVFSIGVNGAGLVPLTNGAKDRDPAWAPGDQWVVFSRAENGVSRLWVVAADGGDPIKLPIGALDEQIESPVWLSAPP